MINYDTLYSEEGTPYMVTKAWMMSYNMLWDSSQWQNYSRSGQLHTITRWIITAMVDCNKFRSNLNNTNCSANMNTHLRHQHTHSSLPAQVWQNSLNKTIHTWRKKVFCYQFCQRLYWMFQSSSGWLKNFNETAAQVFWFKWQRTFFLTYIWRS